MCLIHSVQLGELLNPEDLRRQLLEYCLGIERKGSDVDVETDLGRVPEDRVISPFDSLFEQRVYNRVSDRGYTVFPQWETLGRKIDLVVVGGSNRLAVECDGDTWHGPEQYDHDMARERDLRRCDWDFFRVLGSEFYRDPSAALQPLWELLEEHKIRPVYSNEPEPQSIETLTQESDEPAEVDLAQLPEIMESEDPDLTPLIGVTVDADAGTESSAADNVAPYQAWTTERDIADPSAASWEEVLGVLVEIVETEGPILGLRLYQEYVKAAGKKKVGSRTAKILNRASHRAVNDGLLISDNPLNEKGQKAKTFRLNTQPEAPIRGLGPRDLFDVPPLELAAVIEFVRNHQDDKEEWFKAVLNFYGLRRLTKKVKERLSDVLNLLA